MGLRSTSSLFITALCALGFVAVSPAGASAAPQGPLELWGTPTGPGQLPPFGPDYVAFGRKSPIAVRVDGSYKTWGSAFAGSTPGEAFLDVSFLTGATPQDQCLLRVHDDGTLSTYGPGTPTGLPAGAGYTKVDGGDGFGLALHASGAVEAFGIDTDGQVDDVPAAADYIDIAATDASSHLLRSNGAIESYGYATSDPHGLVSATPAGNDFTSIVGEANTALALRADGSIAAWGDDATGTVSGAPVGTGYSQLALFDGVALALHQDGSIVAWGAPAGDPLIDGVPTGARFAAVGLSNGMAYAVRRTQVGTSLCRADGSDGIVCPCANQSEPGRRAGCRNSTGKGAILTSTGSASIAADDLRFHVLQAPAGQSAVLISGVNWIQTTFRDGVLCAGSPTERIEFLALDSTGAASSTLSIVQESNLDGVGVHRIYQAWYRDPGGSVCGTGSNLTNAVRVGWEL